MPPRVRTTLVTALALGVLLLASSPSLCGSAAAAPARAAKRGDARWLVVSAPGLTVPEAITGAPWVGASFSALAGRSALGLMPSHAAEVLLSRLARRGSGVTVLPATDATEVARLAGALATSAAGGAVVLV